MMERSRVLQEALVRVFRSHVMRTVESRGWIADPALVASIERGEAWLTSELDALLSQPFEAQRRGPLEVFQEATKASMTGSAHA